MTAFEVYKKTFPFVMAKLGLALLLGLVSIVIMAITVGIGLLFGAIGILLGALLGLSGIGLANFVITHYFGYLLKAGHVAVVTETLMSGEVPNGQLAYGKELVKSRFAESNVYFVLDKLVSGAVRQIQAVVQKAGNSLNFIPGMEHITNLANMFVGISLNYIDECCLGYTFYMYDQGAFKSAADGVVIYAKNWKAILKGAALTAIKVIALTVVLVIALLVPIGIIGTLLKIPGIITLLVAFILAIAIKGALLDSYIMIEMMTVYMGAIESTEITFDLYGKLCKWSSKFKELFDKGQAEPDYSEDGTGEQADDTSEYEL